MNLKNIVVRRHTKEYILYSPIYEGLELVKLRVEVTKWGLAGIGRGMWPEGAEGSLDLWKGRKCFYLDMTGRYTGIIEYDNSICTCKLHVFSYYMEVTLSIHAKGIAHGNP